MTPSVHGNTQGDRVLKASHANFNSNWVDDFDDIHGDFIDVYTTN